MSQSVARLKELLFDSESRRLVDVQHQLEALASREQEHHSGLAKQQSAILEKTEAAFDRAGSDDRLLKSVAGIIDGALREAEVNRHDQLSRAIAPLIVKTIKYEFKNSQNEMVDALYPITGKLVKQYVRAAMNDLMADINRRLGGGRLSELEARAKAQGISVAELVFSETQALKVDELFLVRRGAGDLVAHWERPGDSSTEARPATSQGSNRDVLIAGYLSGITAFSEEAFDDKKGSLRSLDMDGERIFVRASPAYLLAARCSGSAPAAVEQIIDDEFVQVLQAYKDTFAKPGALEGDRAGSDAVDALLPTLAASFERRFAEKRDEIELGAAKSLAARPRISRLQIAAALLLLPVLAWGIWEGHQSYQTSRTQQAVAAVVGTVTPLMGYPVQVDVVRGGRTAAISGLAPSEGAKEAVGQRLQSDVGWASVANNLTVLPQAPQGRDVTSELNTLERNVGALRLEAITVAAQKALRRADWQFDAAATSLGRAVPEAGNDTATINAAREGIASARSMSANLLDGIDSRQRRLDSTSLAPLRERLGSVETALASALGEQPIAAAKAASSDRADELAEEVAAAADRIASLAGRAAAVVPLHREIATLKQRIEGLTRTPSPREELAQYTRSNAIFFDNNADLNSAAAADRVVSRIAELLRQTTAILRVVGYTDERTGPSVNNTALAQARAERVVALLVDKGVSRDRLVAVGRTTGPDIARVTGAGTPNRRTEFEVAFEGEPIAR